MKQYQLTSEEHDLLRSYEAGDVRSVRNAKQAVARYRRYAAATLKKPRPINIRMSDRDLARIKALAAQRGVPYQTFISALIHEHSGARAPKMQGRQPTKSA